MFHLPRSRWTSAVAVLLLACLTVGRTAEPKREAPAKRFAPEELAFFEKQVAPILTAHCLNCHGAEAKVKGGLKLTSRAAVLEGGDSGPAVDLTKPSDSLLLKAINHADDLKMPPKGKLPQNQIDALARWVKMGLPYPEGGASAARHGPPQVDDKARNFWAFRPVVRPEVPKVKKPSWVRNPIDAFVLAKLEAAGLQPAPPADKAALLRRVHYSVTGLPPTPAEVDAFLADDSPDAYEKVVDTLLASRHYGEHWGRHWLDLVRFAESNSFERDGTKANAWKYRDYVIRAFNEDKPYNEFVKEQIAGDELSPGETEAIIATGYYRLGIWDDEPADRELSHYDQLDDIVATTGQTFLGLTVNCARCHDHKIDPFPQRDYYRLLAFFHGVRDYGNGESQVPVGTPEELRGQAGEVAEHQRKIGALSKQIHDIEDAIGPKLPGGERDEFKFEPNRFRLVKKHVGDLISKEDFERYTGLRRQRSELNRRRPRALATALAVSEHGPRARDTFVLARGNPQSKGDKVEPGFPAVLGGATPKLPEPPGNAKTAGRRKVLAAWLAARDNPLTARVMVNRMWQYHFGRGIVRSSSNLGYGGTPPTHPELLDWLAAEFVDRGWSMRAIHRMILTSNAFRMSSRVDRSAVAKDPENDLLWRFDPRRLTAEELRDSILAVSGNLNLKKADGPSIYPVIPPEVLAGQSVPGSGWGKSSPEEAASRSVFVFVKRSLTVPLLAAFDVPDPDAPCPVRFTTTQPTQSLAMLNSAFINEQAKIFADSLVKEAGNDRAAQVRLALRRVTQRTPTPAEVERGLKFIAAMQTEEKLPSAEALRRFCLLMMNLNEFVYLD